MAKKVSMDQESVENLLSKQKAKKNLARWIEEVVEL